MTAPPRAATPSRSTRETTEGPIYTVTGGDWDTLTRRGPDDRIVVVNMGPQHPSTHGVLRLVLDARGRDGHPGPAVHRLPAHRHREELEYRTWTQGVTFVTRADYLSPLFNESGVLPGGGEAARGRGAPAGPGSSGCC